jgi:fatty-acyl-CoA synthase
LRTRNGWYWTGDLAYRDEDGFFYFAGRRGDWMRVDSENLTAGPIERVMVRYPGVATVAVYSVPDPRSGDQVMAAFEMLPGRAFDPEGFAAFLDSQPDLGTKWSPSFVRITTGLPQTASGKVTKDPLRAEGWWAGTDPVYRRREAASAYLVMDEDDRRGLRAEFRAHGRAGLVGG